MDTISYPKLTTANKEHKCNFCRGVISKGDKYYKATYVDSGIYDWNTHPSCSSIADKLRMYESSDDGDKESKNDPSVLDKKAKEYASTHKMTYGQAVKAILSQQNN